MVKSNTGQILAELGCDVRKTAGYATFMYSLKFTHLLSKDAVSG
jgi:hypothetical protein